MKENKIVNIELDGFGKMDKAPQIEETRNFKFRGKNITKFVFLILLAVCCVVLVIFSLSKLFGGLNA